MTKIFFLLILIFPLTSIASEVQAIDCGEKYLNEGEVFELTMSRSRSLSSYKIKLCQKPDRHYIIISKIPRNRTQDSDVESKVTILNKNQIIKIRTMYEEALKYNTLDTIYGKDGSRWCLVSALGSNYTKGCFWSPGYKSIAGERGLLGLYNLGVYIWEITGLKESNVKLY